MFGFGKIKNCPCGTTLYAFVEDKLKPRKRRRIGDHIRECSSCQKIIKNIRTVKSFTEKAS